MSVLDFLFEGKPPPSVNTYGQTVENVPRWMSDYTQGLISRANAVAGEPYQPYGGPRIAGFDPAQERAFGLAESNVGKFDPYLDAAGQTTQGALEMAGGVPGAAATRADLATQEAGALGRQAIGVGKDVMGGAASAAERATEVGRGAGAGARGIAAGAQEQAAGASPLAAAAPYLEAASGSFPGAVDEYMNPYIQNVLNRQETLAGRTLEEKFLPALQKSFIGAGAFGSRGGEDSMEAVGMRGMRDIQEGLEEQRLAALSGAYGQAAGIYGQDVGRQAQLAQTVGGLEAMGADIGLRGADVGLRGEDVALRGGELGLRGAGLGIDAGNVGLRGLDLAYRTPEMGMEGARLVGDLGLRGADVGLRGGEQLGALGQVGQRMGAFDAASLEALGAQRRGLGQSSLDLAYEDFLRQRDYPREQIGFMSDIIRGIPSSAVPRTTTTTETGPADIYQPSGLSQILGAYSTYKGLTEARGGLARAKDVIDLPASEWKEVA